ncbi:MAG: PAS domain S-box protein [Proteobacteria bacterium]|nr:PAS domain S-box protein [Pseudomonadota bacterium]
MKILIAEDDVDSRVMLQKNLEGAGHVVEVAVNGQDALDRARKSPPELIISDVLMPVLDGYKFCYEVKNDKVLNHIPFVFYTATYVDLEDERLAIGLGASRYILKPVAPDEFLRLIDEVVQEAQEKTLIAPEEVVEDPLDLFRMYDSSVSRKLNEKIRELDLYRLVFSNSTEAVAIVDRAGFVVKQNPAHYQLLGYMEEDLRGKSPVVYLEEKTSSAIMADLAKSSVSEGEGVAIYRGGKRIAVEYSVFPLRNESNEVSAHVWMLRDIRKRQEAEKQLRLFRTLVDCSGDAIFIIDPETSRFVDVNERACFRLHYSHEELLQKQVRDVDPRFDTMEKWRTHVVQLKADGAAMFESVHRRADGTEFPVEVSLAYSEIGEGDYLMAVARDITERKKAEAQLLLARQEWDRTFDAISDVVTVQDLDMRVIQANKATSDLFQLPVDQIIGKRCHELFCGPGKEPCPGCPIPQARELLMPHMAEIEHPTLGKTFQVTVVPILDERGSLKDVVHFAKDVTEQKNLEAQLLQSQKMEAIGKLAGGVAHDFNNLLSVILGYVEMAQLRFSPSDPVTHELQQVEGAAKRAADLVRQLLLFGRKQHLEFIPIDLRKAIDELVKMLHRVIGEDVRLELNCGEECWEVEGDAGNIDQVVMNLAVNARDAMPDGGVLSMKTENVLIDEEYCQRHPEARPGKFVCLSVSDTGTGMGVDVLPHIFEPFFTTREVGKGTGLGLSVVYGIAKSHKGWINVYSEQNHGTTFRLYLPAVSSTSAKTAGRDILEPGTLLGHGEKILVVEDDTAIRELIVTALGRSGYGVTGAASAEEGLESFAGQGGAFDLVVSDVVLPGMNGVAFVEKLRETQPDIRVLLCSGYADQKSHWPLIQERGYPFLEKPFTIAKLFEGVRNALGKASS